MMLGKIPLCDGHHLKMSPLADSFLPTTVFKCASQDCRRYYAKRYGYFNLAPGLPPAPGQIDPDGRQMKVCTAKQHLRSYMAITRPKNYAPGAKNLWCWHCYDCNPSK